MCLITARLIRPRKWRFHWKESLYHIAISIYSIYSDNDLYTSRYRQVLLSTKDARMFKLLMSQLQHAHIIATVYSRVYTIYKRYMCTYFGVK